MESVSVKRVNPPPPHDLVENHMYFGLRTTNAMVDFNGNFPPKDIIFFVIYAGLMNVGILF